MKTTELIIIITCNLQCPFTVDNYEEHKNKFKRKPNPYIWKGQSVKTFWIEADAEYSRDFKASI